MIIFTVFMFQPLFRLEKPGGHDSDESFGSSFHGSAVVHRRSRRSTGNTFLLFIARQSSRILRIKFFSEES